MVKEVINAPPGFKFKPRDDELITHYLKPKVMGQKLPCNIIDNVHLYAPHATPWLMFDINDRDSWDDEHSRYVFTSLSKVSTDPDCTFTRSRCNTSKKAGCGTWVQKTPRVRVKDGGGNVVGGRRMMVFQVDEVGEGFDESKAVCFRMHEFSLWGVNEGLCTDHGCDLVLCKISFDVSKKALFKVPVEKSDCVTRSGGKGQKMRQSKKKNFEGCSSTSSSVDVISMSECDVLEGSRSLDSQSLVTVNGGAGNGDWSAIALKDLEDLLFFDDIGSDGLGGEEMSFDADKFMEYINSNEEEELSVDRTIQSLGKRKSIEGDNLCPAKKMCF